MKRSKFSVNQHIFESLEDAREKVSEWMEDYNVARPHGSLGWLIHYKSYPGQRPVGRQPAKKLKQYLQ